MEWLPMVTNSSGSAYKKKGPFDKKPKSAIQLLGLLYLIIKMIKDMEQLYSIQLAFTSLLLLPFIFILFYRNQAKKTTSKGLKSYPLVGNLIEFIQNRHRFLEWMTDILSKNQTHTISFQVLGQAGMVVTANPSNIEHMLRSNFDNYPKGDRTISLLEDFLGHGIFNSDGEQWKWQRKAASVEFNTRSLKDFVVGIVQHELTKRLLPLMTAAAEKDKIIDLQDVLERFAFDNICKLAFGEDPAYLAEEQGSANQSTRDFIRAFKDTQYLLADRLFSSLDLTWKIKKLLNIGSERRLKECISIIHNYSMEIIRSRKERWSPNQKDDLLSRFASNKDNTDEFLQDVVSSFILAGLETTSSALTWFFWLVSSRPNVEKKILDDIISVRATSPSSSEVFSFDELRRMHYLHAAISETLRLYPPVPFDKMECKEDDVMPDGTFIRKGWFVAYSAFAIGRMEDIWGEDCREFRPERWLEDGVFRPESPYRFPVFHAGPRTCLGKEMAYTQMKSISAFVLERFEINTVEKDKTPQHLLALTLKVKGGLQIKVKERERKTGGEKESELN